MSGSQQLIERRTAYILKGVKDLIELGRSTFYNPEWRTRIGEPEILGAIVAKYCEWTPNKILKTFSSALEDANLHSLSAQIDDLIKQK